VLEYIFDGSGIGNVWLFLALGSLSAMLVSCAKAGFGGSIGILSMPIMVYACQGRTELALGVMLPILVACDQFSIVPWFGKWDRRIVLLLVPGLVAGVAIGSAALFGITRLNLSAHGHTGDAILTLGIGVIALGFVGIQVYRSVHPRPLPFRPVLWQGSAVGALAGFTSTLAHGAGPIVTMYMLPQNLAKEKFVASTVLYYWIGNLIKLPPYYWLGMLDGRVFLLSLTLVPAVGAGVALGIFLHKRVGQKQFTGAVYVLLALAGTQLVISACRALLG
jgi:hypothetical protein